MKRIGTALWLLLLLGGLWPAVAAAPPAEPRHDAVVVGAGVAGLAAAWELAQQGLDVAVVEMSPSYGGTARVSEGAVCIVGTPEQAAAGTPDSPQIAGEDFLAYGRDEHGPGPEAEWVRYYVTESRREIYDWLTGLGVRFEADVVRMPGNRVPRWHRVVGKGWGLVEPIFRACGQSGRVRFFYGVRAVSLIRDGQAVRGVEAKQVKDGQRIGFPAPVVILATGGFQGNLDMVRQHWPSELPLPDQLLVGAGMNAEGSGHAMAQATGAQLRNMNYQWNYSTGLHNPNDPSGRRGLNAFHPQSIWVNREGRRFVNESQDTRATFPEMLKQPGGTYWAIFDDAAREAFFVSGWSRQAVETDIFGNPRSRPFVKSAPTLRELAEQAGLPPPALADTVQRWNDMAAKGADADFGRLGTSPTPWARPFRIERPPFYAVQFFPLTRKSMGGVAVDRSCRVLDAAGRPIPGLYAAGELTGLAGVNGKASLEGTFLGASIMTGRVAGRAAAAEVKAHSPAP